MMKPIFQHEGPIYLRNLDPDLQADIMEEVLQDPKIEDEYKAGKDVVVGRFIRPMALSDYFAAEGYGKGRA